MFGTSGDAIDRYRPFGILPCGAAMARMSDVLHALTVRLRDAERTTMLTCLLQGDPGVGKSAMAATAALGSGFYFVKVISSEQMVGPTEYAKSAHLTRVFHDAAKSPLSAIFLDDLERLIEYVAVGPRFSNVILQTLLTLLKTTATSTRLFQF